MGTTVTYYTLSLHVFQYTNNEIIKIRTVKSKPHRTLLCRVCFGNFTTYSVIFCDVRDRSKIHAINVGIVSYISFSRAPSGHDGKCPIKLSFYDMLIE